MTQPCPIHKVDLVQGVAVQISGCLLPSGHLVDAWKAEYPLANPAKLKARGRNGVMRKTRYCPECRQRLLDVARELRLPSSSVDETIAAFLTQWEKQQSADDSRA
jgi:hypothetical protein